MTGSKSKCWIVSEMLLQFVIIAAGGCARPTTAVYPTMEEAAIAAWGFPTDLPEEQSTTDRPPMMDRSATLTLMKAKAYKTTADLNGDGVNEVLIDNSDYATRNGDMTSLGGAQNRSWAVLRKADRGWRIIGAGFGSPCPPRVLEDATRGWKDIESGYHGGAGMGSAYLYQFDGARYRRVRETDYGFEPPANAAGDADHAER